VPPILDAAGLTDGIRSAVMLLRWPILFLLGVFGLAMLYRYAPDKPRPAFRLMSWGSAIAAVLWLIGSSAFSFYVTRFDVYDELFGALATVVILMLWLLLSSFAILLGAEIDSALDREADAD
jgi:membrane protein